MRTAALVFFCLVVIPACVLAFAASQPPPPAYVGSAPRQEAIALQAQGWIDVRCAAGRGGGFSCSYRKPGDRNTSYYLLGTTDS